MRYLTITLSLILLSAQLGLSQVNNALEGNPNTLYGLGTVNTGSFNAMFGFQAGASNASGSNNAFLGYRAGVDNTTGFYNTFIGSGAGLDNTVGVRNTFLGSITGLHNLTGSDNVFIGHFSGYENVNASFQTFVGSFAGRNNTTGERNSFLGFRAGFENTTGDNNTFIGNQAGEDNTFGSSNTYVGQNAGQGNRTFSNNTFMGQNAGRLVNGSRNTFLGALVAENKTSGFRNTFLGYRAGTNNLTGQGNVFLGADAGFNETGSDKLYIDNSTTTDPLIYGDFSENIVAVNGALGVGIENPERPIHLRARNAIFRIDRDRDDPGFAIVRYNSGFQDVWKSFYFYTRARGQNDGKFVIADWQTNVTGPSTPRFVIDNEGDIGIGNAFQNLGNDPSARLHVDGTVRFQNLPNGSGLPLVIDAQGNVTVASNNVASAKSDELATLKAEIASLKARLNQLEGLKDVSGSLESAPQLLQNVPNPFDQSTTISYSLPDGVTGGFIIVTNLLGAELQRHPISQAGRGSTTIQAGSFATGGIYLYSLVIDGKLVDTKRMLISK